ncbi:MAG: hypothetical protein QNJ51_21140 [Calothrix sp. MO_167.B12]|nr:hypothetical protein [Calothrix sp. MO_167.B12]
MKTKPLALLSVSLLTAGLNFSTMPSAAAAGITPQQRSRLNRAVNFVFTKAQKEKYRVIKHKWNFQNKNDIKVRRRGRCYIGKGRFTHYLRFVRDDVVDYDITLCNGKIKKINYKYKDRGWSEAVGAVTSGLNLVGINTYGIGKINTMLANKFDGKVRSEGKIIVINIAKRMQQKFSPRR